MNMLPELLHARLAEAVEPARVFFRDDDAGWDHAALRRLLDVFARHGAPLDLAVIPTALDDELQCELTARWDRGDLLGLHQHGYRHCNHERVGRKCEFGAARPRHQQIQDLAAGRRLLRERFAHRVDDIFTPPWNRCSAATRSALRELGIRAISQTFDDSGLADDGLIELPVCLDWQKPRWPKRPLASASPIGVMLHHAELTATDLQELDQLLEFMKRKSGVQLVLMRNLGIEPC